MHHSILLVVSKPAVTDYKIERKWMDCVTILSDLANNNTDIVLLAENVLLISLHQTLGLLSEAVHALPEFDYKYTIFDEEINWREVASKV